LHRDVRDERLDAGERRVVRAVDDLLDPLLPTSKELGRSRDGLRVGEEQVEVLDAVLKDVLLSSLLNRTEALGVRENARDVSVAENVCSGGRARAVLKEVASHVVSFRVVLKVVTLVVLTGVAVLGVGILGVLRVLRVLGVLVLLVFAA